MEQLVDILSVIKITMSRKVFLEEDEWKEENVQRSVNAYLERLRIENAQKVNAILLKFNSISYGCTQTEDSKCRDKA